MNSPAWAARHTEKKKKRVYPHPHPSSELCGGGTSNFLALSSNNNIWWGGLCRGTGRGTEPGPGPESEPGPEPGHAVAVSEAAARRGTRKSAFWIRSRIEMPLLLPVCMVLVCAANWRVVPVLNLLSMSMLFCFVWFRFSSAQLSSALFSSVQFSFSFGFGFKIPHKHVLLTRRFWTINS